MNWTQPVTTMGAASRQQLLGGHREALSLLFLMSDAGKGERDSINRYLLENYNERLSHLFTCSIIQNTYGGSPTERKKKVFGHFQPGPHHPSWFYHAFYSCYFTVWLRVKTMLTGYKRHQQFQHTRYGHTGGHFQTKDRTVLGSILCSVYTQN